MELRDYIRILRKNSILIALIALLTVAAAGVYSLTRTPEYEATSEVFVSSQAGTTIEDQQQGNTYTQARVQSYVTLATRPYVLDTVIDELALDTTATDLATRVTASSPLDTTVISLTVTDEDADVAAQIANAVAMSLTEAVDQVETLPGTETSPVKITPVNDAQAPADPVSPNVPLNLALGLLAGLVLGAAAAALRTMLDVRVRSPRDVEQLTSSPLIGAIPFDPQARDRPIILHADPADRRSEAFRSLRTNLQFLDIEGNRSFVITSSVAGEGKSTTSVNLAIALADAGRKVVLVDADLRKPKIADYLGIEGGVGLTDVLIGRVRLPDVLRKWGRHGLYVLPAGKVPPNPSELLGSRRMTELLESVRKEADVVILDAPPLLPVTDATVLARLTGGAIVVVAAGRTTRPQLSGALDALETVHANVAGMVLSMVPTRGPDAYYDYDGYGYGYGAPAPGADDARADQPATRNRRARRSRG
ncbi:polysaccharide biosynthesis tyrosine autokinase [Microbacterium betulae]|uniref:non-specific protein-tyrosine kinase n=1 Tax=Microbacterium betulae TaxID=2981139 RepID=A0AA97I5M8_9MICO|nr:polysaccharide biosynthesis tyrosine autokinase [Microbacterium sp. AB]WOF22257.1 polysaccharide biosynthesis tyrosine autokinase [Microbacterium sp. AB]